jgi:hypothetical protein
VPGLLIRRTVRGFTVHPGEFHDAGSAVVVEARYTGTFKETGKELDA